MSIVVRWRYSRRQRPAGDEGTSMIDLVVGMGLMMFFMAMFTGAIYMMNNTRQKAESVSQTSSQLNQAFLTLDRTVRYADAITTPGTGGSGYWYVEMRAPSGTTEICTQLRVNTVSQQLQRRAWTVGNTPPTTFTPVASDITNGTAGMTPAPFVLRSLAGMDFQQLTINLVSAVGTNKNKTESRSSVTFTAVNSTIPAPSGPICGEDQAANRP